MGFYCQRESSSNGLEYIHQVWDLPSELIHVWKLPNSLLDLNI